MIMVRHKTRRKNGKNKQTGTREEGNPAPVRTRGAETDLFLVTPPPPPCLHREKKVWI
jgi:hypothetical protein